MDRIINYTISQEYNDKQVSSFLVHMGYSSRILTFLRHNMQCVLVNGTPSFLNTRLVCNDSLIINILEESPSENIVPINLPFEIVYEDDDIILVNKPADMPIHPSLNNYENSLANALAFYFKNESSPFVYRCINRLDRDTSGLTLIAKNPLSGAILSRDMKERRISRTYTALVCGKLSDPCGRIDKPIARKMESCIERCVDYDRGEKAITNYQVLSYYESSDLSLVSLNLETGRTHQIRVHMSSISHPLIGDFLYNPGSNIIKRQALHAGELAFTHPITKRAMHFNIPLPKDMAELIY